MVSAAWWTVHNPLFFHRALIVTGGHLGFECTEGVGIGIYCGGEGGEKKRGNLYFSCLLPNHPLLPK